MNWLNVEIKAKCRDAAFIREKLRETGAAFRGRDEQTDTYFQCNQGRLKLREGIIENNLIYYERPDQPGPKDSSFHLLKTNDPAGLREILSRALGIKVIVKKYREIYYSGNVKFHLDDVPGLGSFVEIEAGNLLADLSREELEEQCRYYLQLFGVESTDLIDRSYSDLLIEASQGNPGV